MNNCSVNKTVPKYSRCLFAAVKGDPTFKWQFFLSFSSSTRRGCWTDPEKTKTGFFFLRDDWPIR